MTVAAATGLLAAVAVLLFGSGFAASRRDSLRAALAARSTTGSPPTSRRSLRRGPLVAVAAGIGIPICVVALGPVWAVCAGLAAAGIPVVLRRRARVRRTELVEAQLADAVGGLAAGMRAGLSLLRSVESAAAQTPPPLGSALRGIVDRAELGERFEPSLRRWVDDVGGPDVRLVAGVLALHRRTGGDLPAVLDEVAATLRERRAAARELRSLTAQARLSGAILGLLPIGFFLFLSLTAPHDLAIAYRSTAGAFAIVIGLAMQAIAFLWIRHLLRVEG